REVEAAEGRVDGLGEGLDGERLGEPGHPFEEYVAVGEESDEEAVDEGALADDDGGDLLAQADGEARTLAYAIVDGGDAGVHETDLVTDDRPGAQIRDRALQALSSALPTSPLATSSSRPNVSGTRNISGASRSGRTPRSAMMGAWPPIVADSSPTSASPIEAPATLAFVTQARAVARSAVGKLSVVSALTDTVMPDSKNTTAANAGKRYPVL